jgi:putative phage-type endonuclease
MKFENRNDWLKWRHGGIGSSEAAIVHDVSEWSTRYELGEIKRGPCPPETPANFAQEKGNAREPIARARFSAEYNIEHGTDEDFEPRCVEVEELPFMRASLDGSSKDGKVIAEFKTMSDAPTPGKALTPGQQKHVDVLNGDLPLTAREGRCRVPLIYFIQIQHQLLISGAERCFFVSFDGETHTSCEILPDVNFLKGHIDLCTEFWMLVLSGKPQPISERDYKELRVKGMAGKVQKWKRLKLRASEIEDQMEALRTEILAVAEKDGHPRLRCSGISIVKQAGRAGSMDWQKAYSTLADLAKGVASIEIEKYKKPDGKSFYKMEIE